jgi:polysaccharide chain length determinant protein (PEP-CTERM system associated)
MNSTLEQLQTQIWSMWRYHWQAMLMAWVICIFGWLLVFAIPDKYEVSSRIHVDTQSVLKPLLRGLTVETNVLNTVSVMTQALLSRPNLAKVARDTDLHIRAKNEKELEAVYKELQKKIRIKALPSANNNLFLITYYDSDPTVAKKVVDSLLTGFVENTLGENRLDTKSAQIFLDEQIAEYETRLEAAEIALKDFKQKNVGLMPDTDTDYYQRLQSAMHDLEQATLEWREANNKARALRRQLSGEEPTLGFSVDNRSNKVTMDLDTRINKLEEKLDELRTTFTDNHPDVAALVKSINDLKQQKQNEIQKLNSMGVATGPEENPVYQQLKIALGAAEAEASALNVRKREYKARVEKLEKLVDTIPRVEAELAKLNRDYNVIKNNYETLLARRESARLSKKAEQNADDITFRVLEPPRMPLTPAGPNRILFSTIVLLAGIAGGLGLAFFFTQIKPVFITGKQLMEFTGLPLLGSVSLVGTKKVKQKNKRVLKRLSVTGGLLFMMYILVIFLHKYDLLNRITETAMTTT